MAALGSGAGSGAGAGSGSGAGSGLRDELRRIVAAHGKLSMPIETVGDEADLFALGMDSLAVVNVMLSIEDRFGIEVPDAMLNRRSFATVATLAHGLLPLVGQQAL
jgi:acyl carrier protein